MPVAPRIDEIVTLLEGFARRQRAVAQNGRSDGSKTAWRGAANGNFQGKFPLFSAVVACSSATSG
jgi:hypothetical protein